MSHPLARPRAVAIALAMLFALFVVVASAPAASAATLTGMAFQDLDRDGAWQTSEPVLSNQEIDLYSAGGSYLAYAVTDAFGRYTFADLAEGAYSVAYDVAAWWALRDDWAPTTTPSLQPTLDVSVSATTTADFGWRPITRSTDAVAPISSYTGPSGLKVSSYNDVVTARELHDTLVAGALIGAEAPSTKIAFDLYAGDMTSASAQRSNGGPYQNFNAMSYVATSRGSTAATAR